MSGTRSKKKDILSNYDNIRLIYEEVPIGIAIVDSDTKLVTANKTLIDMMGGDGIIEIGKRFGDSLRCVGSLVSGCGNGEACILCEIRTMIRKTAETGLASYNILLRHDFIVNEQEISPWFQMSFVPVTIDHVNYVMISLNDVTTIKV